MDAGAIIEAYRWQRALGNGIVEARHGRLVVNADRPEVWDANHADAVTAATPEEADELLADMDGHFAHTSWRVVHTDPTTPAPFGARLALDGFVEQPAVIQMVLAGTVAAATAGPAADLAPVETDADWGVLAALVRRDHEEGARTGGKRLSPVVTDAIVSGYRAKDGPYRFHLSRVAGRPVGYGALALAPSGAGMIEDLFTLAAFRRRGIASAMIAAFAAGLDAEGARCVFLGAQAGERARHLYARLGFRPIMLTRCWVRNAGSRDD